MKRNLIYSCLFIALSLILFQSCKKDETDDPQVQTLEATALAPNKALLKGSIVSKGKKRIIDYGFVYSANGDISETTGTKISMGSAAPEGEFSKEADGLVLISGYSSPTLYVRAYLTNEAGTAFGKLMTVNMPSFATSSISPQAGKSGDQITINGNFYTTSADQVEVAFNNVKGKVISASNSKIVVEVPSGISAVHNSQVPVQVRVGGQVLPANYGFTIQANVKDYSPKSGPVGTVITFTGDNLPSYYYSNDIKLLFGQTEGYMNYYSNGTQCTVPVEVSAEKFQISVITGGKTVALPGEFTVLAPSITSVSPTSGLAGSYFVISGTNFPTNISNSPVAMLGSYSLYLSTASSTQYSGTIPTNISAGEYTLTLKVGPHTVTAPQKIKIVNPSISSFSPSSGSPGRQVDIEGNFLSGQNYTVYFGSVTTYGTATSSTNLRTYVPTGIDAGKVKIAIQNNSERITASNEFTITGPSITSFSPKSGVPGTVVTIYGTGFDTYSYYTSVKFGTVATTIISSTDTYIKVSVPSNTGLGAMKINITNNGQTVTSDESFTVTDK